MKMASFDSLIINAARKPRIEARSELFHAPYNDKFGYDEVITDGGNYQAVGYVSQEIFTGKVVQNKYRAIEDLKLGLGIDKKITEAELKQTIAGLYLDSYSAYSDLEFNRALLGIIREQVKIIEQFVKSAIYNQSDYLAALVEAGEQEIIVERLRALYQKNTRLLNQVCGLTDTSSVKLAHPDIVLSLPGEPGSFLLLKQYIADSLNLINEFDALTLKYRPSVNWFADAGMLTSNPWNFYRHFGASAGITLSLPVFDGRQRKFEENKLEIRENTRSFYSANYRKQYDQKYLSLKNELEGAKGIKNKLESQLAVSRELVKSLRLQLENGIVKMTDYLSALKSYRGISHNLNMADIEILRITNEINFYLAE